MKVFVLILILTKVDFWDGRIVHVDNYVFKTADRCIRNQNKFQSDSELIKKYDKITAICKEEELYE